MKNLFKLLPYFLSLMLLFQVVTSVYAAPIIGIKQPAGTGVVDNGNADSLLGTVLKNGVLVVFTFASIAVVLYFLWGAFDFIISQGDKEKMGAARKKITASLIGLAVLALSFVIIGLIGSIVGINPLSGKIPFLGDDGKSAVERIQEQRRGEQTRN